MDAYEALAHLLATPEPARRATLGELDYREDRPEHLPGGNAVDPRPDPPEPDPDRFDYPTPQRRSWRSGHQQP
jgi:hypothetical protein